MVQYADSERHALLGYAAAPRLDRNLVARYALGEPGLAGSILAPFRSERFGRIWGNLTALAEPALGSPWSLLRSSTWTMSTPTFTIRPFHLQDC